MPEFVLHKVTVTSLTGGGTQAQCTCAWKGPVRRPGATPGAGTDAHRHREQFDDWGQPLDEAGQAAHAQRIRDLLGLPALNEDT